MNGLQTLAPGVGFNVTGRGCTPRDQVRVALTGATPVVVAAGGDGRFSAGLAAPTTVGRFEVHIECGTGEATVPLDVVTMVSTSAPHPPAATAASVLVAGCFLFFLLNGLVLRPGRRGDR